MQVSQGLVLPTAPPKDADLFNRITKLATYVVKNGADFEEKVKANEQGNDKFSFLFGGEYSSYYKWYLAASHRGLSAEQIQSIESSHRDQIVRCPPGFIDLTSEDYEALDRLLQENSGSKESIKALRKWIMERAHSACAIGIRIRVFLTSMASNSGSEPSFPKLLHTLYVLNDVLYNKAQSSNRGIYTKLLAEGTEAPVDFLACMWPQMPTVMWTAYRAAGEDTAGKDRLEKLLDLWASKQFIDESQKAALAGQMKDQGSVPNPPPNVNLLSPCVSLPSMQQQQQQVPPPTQMPPHMMPQPVMLPGANPNLNLPPPPFATHLPPPPPLSHMGHPSLPPGLGQHQQLPQLQLQQQPQQQQQHPMAPGLAPPPGPPPGTLPLPFSAVLAIQQHQQQQQHMAMQINNANNNNSNPMLSMMMQPQQMPPNPMMMLPGQQQFPGMGPIGMPMPMHAFPSPMPGAAVQQQQIPSSSVIAPTLDLQRMSVGSMANIVRQAVKLGQKKYSPLDMAIASQIVPPAVEPGRLEVRVNDFYRKLVDVQAIASAQSLTRSSNHSRQGDEGPSYGHQYPTQSEGNVNNSYRGYPPPLPPPALTLQAPQPLADDNLGHQILKGLGWSEGSGLGASGNEGIVEPIREVGNRDKSGVGSGADPETLAGGFASYRSKLSAEYFVKISDR